MAALTRWNLVCSSQITTSAVHRGSATRGTLACRMAVCASGDNGPYWRTVVNIQPLAAGDLQLPRIEAELVQNGRVYVGHIVPILDGVEADLVGLAVDEAPLQAAAGHQDAEAEDVVVAA